MYDRIEAAGATAWCHRQRRGAPPIAREDRAADCEEVRRARAPGGPRAHRGGDLRRRAAAHRRRRRVRVADRRRARSSSPLRQRRPGAPPLLVGRQRTGGDGKFRLQRGHRPRRRRAAPGHERQHHTPRRTRRRPPLPPRRQHRRRAAGGRRGEAKPRSQRRPPPRRRRGRRRWRSCRRADGARAAVEAVGRGRSSALATASRTRRRRRRLAEIGGQGHETVECWRALEPRWTGRRARGVAAAAADDGDGARLPAIEQLQSLALGECGCRKRRRLLPALALRPTCSHRVLDLRGARRRPRAARWRHPRARRRRRRAGRARLERRAATGEEEFRLLARVFYAPRPTAACDAATFRVLGVEPAATGHGVEADRAGGGARAVRVPCLGSRTFARASRRRGLRGEVGRARHGAARLHRALDRRARDPAPRRAGPPGAPARPRTVQRARDRSMPVQPTRPSVPALELVARRRSASSPAASPRTLTETQGRTPGRIGGLGVAQHGQVVAHPDSSAFRTRISISP